jgi:hypothetical protein
MTGEILFSLRDPHERKLAPVPATAAFRALSALSGLTGVMGGGSAAQPEPEDYSPALDFSDARNSQYAWI